MKIAGVREQGRGPYHGLAAWLSVHDLNVSRDQASYANIYAGSVLNNKTNFIETGWMVKSSLIQYFILILYKYIYIYLYLCNR